MKRKKDCENCSNCLYIGEGDSCCTAVEPPKFVLEDFSLPTEDFLWCKGKEWTEN